MNIISLAAVRGENTSASYVFVFVGVLSSLPPAPHTEAAFLLSGKHKAFSDIGAKVCPLGVCPVVAITKYCVLCYYHSQGNGLG